jgi:hypothetical protein
LHADGGSTLREIAGATSLDVEEVRSIFLELKTIGVVELRTP